MPKFAVISPTDVSGKAEYAWENFRKGGYIAMGGVLSQDLAGKSLEEVYKLIDECPRYDAKLKKIRKRQYKNFLSLKPGDLVAVKVKRGKNGFGLLGIGVITSNYYFKEHAHDTGSSDVGNFYCHFYSVKWFITSYMDRKDILKPGEKGWSPYQIIHVYSEIPDYIRRIVNLDTVKSILDKIKEEVNRLKSDHKVEEVRKEALIRKYGSKGEGSEHRKLKKLVLDHPEKIGIQNVIHKEEERRFLYTQDLADVYFELADGRYVVVEIETTDALPGAFQALKYKVLKCAELGIDIKSDKVIPVLVAWNIPQDVRDICRKYGIRWIERKM